jgi:putative spermidine/putrescine transport system permease protein
VTAAAISKAQSSLPRKRAVSGTGGRAETLWLAIPPLAFFLIALVVPIIALFVKAAAGNPYPVAGETRNAFLEAFQTPIFIKSIGLTLILAVVVTIVTVVLGYFYAMGIAASPAWLKVVLTGGLLLSLWTSIMVRSFGWILVEIPKGAIYWFLNLVGLADQPIQLYQTTLGMYPAMIAVMLPFAVLPLTSAIGSLDREQLNAAAIFGAGPMLTFRKVILPAVSPAMISAGVLVFVLSLGFYVTPLLLGGPSNMTVSVVINTEISTANRPDLAAAMSILLIGGTVIIYLIADRLFKVSEKWG